MDEEEAVPGPSRRPNSFRSAPPLPPLLVLVLPVDMLPLACEKKK
eukprot:COSAG06_NODE_20014_length_813_cov_0.795518_1_plen_44_part_01